MRNFMFISLLSLSATTVACNNEVAQEKETQSDVDRDSIEVEDTGDGSAEAIPEEDTGTDEPVDTGMPEDIEDTDEPEDTEDTDEPEDTEDTDEPDEPDDGSSGPVIDDPDVEFELLDSDGDGFPVPIDCNDSDSSIHPGAEEFCGDGINSNCASDDDDGGECTELTPADVLGMIECSGTPGEARITGEVIDVTYNEYGFWNQRSYSAPRGFRFGNGGADWTDLYMTSTDPQNFFLEFNVSERLGVSSSHYYSSSWEPEGGDFDPDCMEIVEIGNVIGIQHEYPMDDGVTVTKTELWDRDSGAMLIDIKVSPGSGRTVTNLKSSHFTKTQLDDEYNVEGASTSDDRWTGAVGLSSGWSFGYGVCDADEDIVGTTVWWYPAIEPDMCMPGSDYESSRLFGWAHSTGAGLSAMGPKSMSFVISVGTSSSEAINEYEDWGEDLCGSRYESGSPDDLDTCG